MKQSLLRSITHTIMSAFLLVSASASAQLLYQEGSDYTKLETPMTLAKPGQKEVAEFFSYSCPHCANLEPAMVEWRANQKPEDVEFRAIPAVGGRMWTFTAQAKYTADKLDLGDKFDLACFNEIHGKNNRRLLGDKDSVIDFMVSFGADKEKAEKAWDSLQVKSKLKKSAQLMQQAQIQGVPAVVVNGKYLVPLKDYRRFFAVIDYLLATTQP